MIDVLGVFATIMVQLEYRGKEVKYTEDIQSWASQMIR